jgi:hypothetical protein
LVTIAVLLDIGTALPEYVVSAVTDVDAVLDVDAAFTAEMPVNRSRTLKIIHWIFINSPLFM